MKFNLIKSPRRALVLLSMAALFSAVPASLYAAPRTIIILPFVSDGNIGYSWIAAGIYNYLERAMRGNSSI
ncbi:MAG TPA: hypothetical protein VF857_09545, partial [Spirochaetota bacterium]